jgi:hypothetical protein
MSTKKSHNRKTYASLVSTTVTNDAPPIESPDVNIEDDEPNDTYSRRCVTNYTPPKRNCCYDTWEREYFQYLITVREIFIQGLVNIDKKYMKIDLLSPEFFYLLSTFIYDVSSQYISPYLEEFPEYIEDEYIEYVIKRNTSLDKDNGSEK